MENKEIEEIENEVVEFMKKLKSFAVKLSGRTQENYNHLGTLNVNLTILKSEIEKVIERLGFWDIGLTKNDYQKALDSQTACNLSGIVFSFAEIMKRICNEDRNLNEGTEWRNKHPICRLFAEQIIHLTGNDTDSWFAAFKKCTEEVRDEEVK